MSLRITDTKRYVTDLTKRMPFHFGNVVVTEGPHHFLKVELEDDCERYPGLSMVGMAPMWFLKDPELSMKEATRSLLDVFDAACEHALEVDPSETVFDLWYDLYRRQEAWGRNSRYPPLLVAYGVSMVEQAVIDAYCRGQKISFTTAVRTGELGIALDRIYDELRGVGPGELLPHEANRTASVRHTIGLTDPLWRSDIDDDSRLDDGLPQAFEEYVAVDGVNHFKIKLSADQERDAFRLATIADILDSSGLDEYLCTLDANEQYRDVPTFQRQWEQLSADDRISDLLDHVAFVEQPLPRARALTDETREYLLGWEGRPPIIIDESDDRLDSGGQALECGYVGTSHKNCKGVFKGIANACLLEQRRRDGEAGLILSGEDLSTNGPVELLHDLAVMGTIGVTHLERNGHHYYRGLSSFDHDVQGTLLAAHPDLYRRHEDGFATLDVSEGEISFGSVVDAPFGRDFDLDLSQFARLEEWTAEFF